MSELAKKGQWVRIKNTIPKVGEQAPGEARAVPLDMWINGFLVNETAAIGDTVTIRSLAGAIREGAMVEIEPVYTICR